MTQPVGNRVFNATSQVRTERLAARAPLQRLFKDGGLFGYIKVALGQRPAIGGGECEADKQHKTTVGPPPT
jgi:hypothetical protein